MKGGKEKPVFLLFPDNADLEGIAGIAALRLGIAGMKHFGKIQQFRLQVLTIPSIILCGNGGSGMPLKYERKYFCLELTG